MTTTLYEFSTDNRENMSLPLEHDSFLVVKQAALHALFGDLYKKLMDGGLFQGDYAEEIRAAFVDFGVPEEMLK